MIYTEERHNKILELLNQNGRVDSTELMLLLNTSRETIRRDLNALADKGMLIKTHGGAISPQNTSLDFFTPLKARENTLPTEKKALCCFAAKNVKDYDTIYLDNSTTVSHIIYYIPKQCKVTFITNSVHLLTEFSIMHNINWTVISLGGALDYSTSSTFHYLAITNLKNFKPNKAFISCHGIDKDFSVTDTRVDDIELKHYILKTCKETFLLADSSKMQREGVSIIGDAASFHRIITNDNIDPLFLSRLNTHGCKLQLVPLQYK